MARDGPGREDSRTISCYALAILLLPAMEPFLPMYILQIDFPFNGPFGKEMTQAMRPLAEDIATENELLWKIWTEDADTRAAGGIYLFASRVAAETYQAKHSQRLQAAGVSDIRSRIFAINQPLSHINRAPL